MNIEPKKCGCCYREHVDDSQIKPDKTVVLAEFFSEDSTMLKIFAEQSITHQVDCICGSTLYVKEMKR